MSIQHLSAQHKFADGQAELVYQLPAPGVIDFTHTEVPEAKRGQGEGEALVKTGLDYARQHHLQVVATCPFVAAYFEQHPEYADLLAQ